MSSLPVNRTRLSTASHSLKASKLITKAGLRNWIAAALAGGDRGSTQRGLMLERLEGRQMLAGDVELFATLGEDSRVFADEMPAELFFSTNSVVAQGEEVTQGPDLVAFAQLLTDLGVVMYSADWCPVCTQQKSLFGDGQNYLNIVEVTDGSRQLNEVGVINGISQFPTWDFDAETRVEGLMTLEEIAATAGVQIPISAEPSFVPIPAQTVETRSPVHVPVNAYHPTGQPLTVTATVDDPGLLEAVVLEGNRSLRLSIANYGDMVFELFEQRAPRPAGRVIELAESGFYDDLIFHRVIDGFVIQGGDPLGTGTGGSDLGNFDDQYHPDLRHTTSGILSFAKSNNDTNNSQFFITAGPTPHLDFNHSIFGQLVEGESVRAGISRTAVNAQDRPVNTITIESATVFEDTQNSVVMLRPTGNGTGTTNVTFTVTDPGGRQFTQIVPVTVGPAVRNALPFLADIAPVTAPQGTPAQFQLEAIDVDGDPVAFSAQGINAPTGTDISVTPQGLVTVTPPANYSGTIDVLVGTFPEGSSPASDASRDTQQVTVLFAAGAPAEISLTPESDTGSSSTDNVTRAASLTFVVSGVTGGATVELLVDDVVVGVGTAANNEATITTNNFAALGDGTYQVRARQRGSDGVNSPLSPPLTLVYDTTPPVQVSTTGIPLQAHVGFAYVANLSHPEEGQGLEYGLVSGPQGLTIDSESGLIQWTPTETQAGPQIVELRLTDLAGNQRTQSLTINVQELAVGELLLEVTDLQGNPLSTINVGKEFLLRLSARDARGFDAEGVFAAYADIDYEAALASVAGENAIVAATGFTAISGDPQAGRIRSLGAFSSSLTPVGGEESLVATVRMRADRAGELTLVATPPTADGTDFLLYSRDDRVPPAQVAFGSASLTIVASFTVVDDLVTVDQGSSNNVVDVLANDQSSEGTVLTLVSVTQPSSGGTTVIEDGKVRYTPPASFAGTDTFTYLVRDGAGVQQSGTVTVTVVADEQQTPVENSPPPAGDVTKTVIRGTSDQVVFRMQDAGANVDGPDEVVNVTSLSETSAGGIATISEDGQAIRYTPPSAEFLGVDTLTYTVTDDGGLSASGTITIRVEEFQPRSFTVEVPTLDNLSGFVRLSGRLVGTTAFGDEVVLPLVSEPGSRMLRASDQPPGSYRIEIDPIPFLQGMDQMQMIEFQSDLAEGDLVRQLVASAKLEPRHYRLRDSTTSAPQRGAFIAVEPGKTNLFALPIGTANQTQALEVDLDELGAELTVRVTEPNGVQRTGQASTAESMRTVELRAVEGQVRLLRVNLADTAITYDRPAQEEAPDPGPASNGNEGSSQVFIDESGLVTQGESVRLDGVGLPVVGLGAQPRLRVDQTPAAQPPLTLPDQGRQTAEQVVDAALQTEMDVNGAFTAADLLVEPPAQAASQAAAIDTAIELLGDQKLSD